jgi:Secretion system C-terminal sorting domain
LILAMLLAFSLNTQAQVCHCDDPNATVIGASGVTTNVTDAINQGLLLPMPQVASIPQNVCIRGTLNVNKSYTFTTSQLNMDADAAMTVSGYLVTLTIDNSIVYGCYEMWNSITSNPLSWLVITASTIEDGEQAVSAFAGSILTLQDNTFQNNYVGIHAFSGSPVLYGVFQWVPTTGNTFITSGDLLPPYDGESGFAGIQLTNISGFTVGTTNQNAPANHFENLQNGIVANRSTFTLDGATFTDIVNAANPLLPNATMGNGVFITNRCNLTASDNDFDHCTVGIHAQQSSMNVFNNTMEDGVIYGVRVNGANMANVNIHDNFFIVPRLAIQVLQATNNSTVTVRNNTITTVDLDLSPTFDGFAGILFYGCNFQPNNPGIIEDNTLDLDATLFGISLSNCSSVRVIDNSVTIQPIPPDEIAVSNGISVTGSESCIVSQVNEVLGINSDVFENVGTRGIVNASSTNIRYCCNIVNGTFEGMTIDGVSNGTDFYWTIFGAAIQEGLLYLPNGITGAIGSLTFNPNNRWSEDEGDYGIAGAEHDGLDPIFIQMSKHFSYPFESPTLPPSIEIPNAPGAAWFVQGQAQQSNNCPTSLTCDYSLTKEELDTTDHIIASRNWDSGTSFQPALKWQAERYLLRELEQNPDLMEGETEIQSFYSSMEDSTAQLFNEVDKNIQLLDTVAGGDITQYIANLTAITGKLDSLAILDSLIWEASPSELEDLQDEKSSLIDATAELETENEDLFWDIMPARSTAIGAIISQNSSIDVTEIFEENEKTVNDIWLRTAARGDAEFDSTQMSQLEDIAWQCPLEGGNAVYKARSLYLMAVDTVFNDDELCYGQERSTSSRPAARKPGKFGLYPNPAGQSVTLTLDGKSSSFARVVITNLYGGQVFQAQIPVGQSKFTFPVYSIPSGIYFLRVYQDDDEAFSEKLLIVH